jgi:copper chaperone
MCSCNQHHNSHQAAGVAESNAFTFRVEDMTCGHCAGVIKKAIETAIPGAEVSADPDSKLVAVKGSRDLARLKEIVADAGYTAAAVLQP